MFRKYLQSLLAVVVAVLAFGAAPSAVARDEQRFVVFGDSLSDPGNAFVLLMDVELLPFELVPGAPYARGGLQGLLQDILPELSECREETEARIPPGTEETFQRRRKNLASDLQGGYCPPVQKGKL